MARNAVGGKRFEDPLCLRGDRRRSADIGRLRQIGFRDAHTIELTSSGGCQLWLPLRHGR